MDNWSIEQVVDLQNGFLGPLVWPSALLYPGDHLGHTWRVRVLADKLPTSMDGFTVEGHFTRADGYTVPVKGEVQGSLLSVTLIQDCYAVPGDLQCYMRVSKGARRYEISAITLGIGTGPSDSYVSPDGLIPSLAELLALVEEMREAAQAAEAVVSAAEAAVDRANLAAGNAETEAAHAGEAAQAANAAAARWEDVDFQISMLPPDGLATGGIAQTDTSTSLFAKIPQGRVTNATLYVDDATGELVQRMPVLPEVGMDYAYDQDTTELHLRVHGY